MTHSTVIKMRSDESLKTLAANILNCRAYEQTVSAIISPKQQEIIDFYKFEVLAKWHGDGAPTIVDNKDHLYLASDEDFNIYIKEMHNFYLEQGFNVEFGTCPLLVAESLTRLAKHAFCDALAAYTKLDTDDVLCSGVETYKEYIELNLSLMYAKAA